MVRSASRRVVNKVVEMGDRQQLHSLGWSSDRDEEADESVVARIAVEHRGYYDVLGLADDPLELVEGAAVSPTLRRSASSPLDFPAVGDWVTVRPGEGSHGNHIIDAVLTRSSLFVRRAPGREPRPQVVGANVDRIFVVSGLDGDLNPRRLERYLAVARGGGAEAVVVLSKADQVDSTEAAVELTRSVGGDVRVIVSSLIGDLGLDEIRELTPVGMTVAMVGSSGVGKSSLINALLGSEVQNVAETQRDGRGRHTTIRRHLLPIPAGGFIIDTPGMREVQLWNGAGLAAVFWEIYEAATNCRFADCQHREEPGCAVLEGVASGEIDIDRLEGLRRLTEELDDLSDEITRRRRARRDNRR